MRYIKKNIYAATLQETWLKGNYHQQLPNGKLLVHHGPASQKSARGQGGVAIILRKEAVEDWKENRYEIEYGGANEKGTTRLMSITTKIFKIKSQNYTTLKLVSAYFPDSGKTEDIHQNFKESFLDIIKTKKQILII